MLTLNIAPLNLIKHVLSAENDKMTLLTLLMTLFTFK